MNLISFLNSPAAKKLGWALCGLAVAGMAILPMTHFGSNAELFTLTLMLTSIGVAINWNITGGFTGYVDFGHAVWFGLGAYVTSMLMAISIKLDPVTLEETVEADGLGTAWGPVPAIIVGALFTGLCAAGIGRATMRLKGPYFSIAMLGTLVAVREIVRVAEPITGGGVGLNLPPYINRPLFYYIHLVLVVVLGVFTWWLRKSQFGTNLIAIREDEIGAEMRGINTIATKVAAFSFSGFSTAVFGGLWAYQNTSVDPDIAFIETRTIDAVLGTLFGGIGTVLGPILGSAGLFWLKEVLWARFTESHLIFQGVLLILLVMYMPKGIAGLFDTRGTSLATIWSKWMPSKDESPDASPTPKSGSGKPVVDTVATSNEGAV